MSSQLRFSLTYEQKNLHPLKLEILNGSIHTKSEMTIQEYGPYSWFFKKAIRNIEPYALYELPASFVITDKILIDIRAEEYASTRSRS